MDSSTPQDSTGCRRRHHHHHHPVPRHHHHYFHVSPRCPLHQYMLHLNNHHAPTCPVFASSHPPSQNPELLTALSSIPPPIPLSLQSEVSGFSPPDAASKEDEELEEQEHQQLYDEEEEEEDPVFVLTDEWREFFAKSEAKRKLAKKQARLKEKKSHRMEQ